MAIEPREMFMFCTAMLDAALESGDDTAITLWDERAQDAYIIYGQSEAFYGYAEMSKHFGHSIFS